jgi:hypothetical protein
MSPLRGGLPGGRRESQPLQNPDELENLLRFEGWSRWFWQAKPDIVSRGREHGFEVGTGIADLGP